MTVSVTVELFYDGAWHTVPVYTRDPVVVTIGRSGESTETPPASASFTISNRTFNYNPAYGGSVLFGKAGRYTPVRITIGSEVYQLEMAKWVPGRSVESVNGTRGDAWVRVTAAGIRRRLGQGRDPLKSAHYRSLKTHSDILAYWPLDEGAGSLRWTDLIHGIAMFPSTFSAGQITSGQTDMAPWLEKGLHMDSGALIQTSLINPGLSTGTGHLSMTWVTRRMDPSSNWQITFTNADGTDTLGGVTVFGSLNEVDVKVLGVTTAQVHPEANVDGPICWNLVMANSGSDIAWQLIKIAQDGVTTTIMSATRTGKSVVPVGFVLINGGVNIGHVALFDNQDITAAYSGWLGEDSGDRFDRLCTEEGITHTTNSASHASVLMGPQYPGTILEQFSDIERTDDAIIADTQDARGVTFYPGPYRYNRTAALTIDFNLYQLSPGSLPVLDDLDVRNDITVKRRDGASVRVTQDTGPSNTQDPTADPQGIGRVTDQPTVNCKTDAALTNIANWILHVKTYDGVRCPTVTVDMVATPSLPIADIGDRISMTNLPADLGPSTLDLLVVGRTDTATPGTRIITYTTIPFDPYRVFQLETGADNLSRIPAADGETTLNGTLTTTATSVAIVSATQRWIDSATYGAQFPFDIIVNGERMRVTACTGTTLFQTFTVIRSINGVVKAHDTSEKVQLFQPPVIVRP